MSYPLVMIVAAFLITLISVGQSITDAQNEDLRQEAIHHTVDTMYLYWAFLKDVTRSMPLDQLPSTDGAEPMHFVVDGSTVTGLTPIILQPAPAVPQEPVSASWLPSEFTRLKLNNALYYNASKRAVELVVWSDIAAPDFIGSLLRDNNRGSKVCIKKEKGFTSFTYKDVKFDIPDALDAAIRDGTYVIRSMVRPPIP